MIRFGYTLSSEEHGPRTLVDNARLAEEAGFDFLSISDHFHPWMETQGHSPFVWSVLGGIAAATTHIDVGVGVTCPIIRIHPAVVAHAAATTSLLFGDRFFFGVGTGEALNEHILGHRWPAADVRLKMLEEAVEVMRQMWTGDNVSFRGDFYEVENARLFDPPGRLPVIVSGFGDKAIELAAKIGDGLWGHGTDPSSVNHFRESGGSGPKYVQATVCWAPDVDTARKTVHEVWPNGAVPGQLSQDLPTWNHFKQATELVDEDKAAESTPVGPDVEPFVESVREYVDAGFDHIYLHQIGPDQRGFLEFWQEELGPALSGLAQ
ncbi:MAG: hypothetical protein QOJ00_140 [Actinomycetota bacterium]